jgi:hypothetical protein
MMIEGSGSGAGSNPYLWLVDPDPDHGGPKTCGSGGSGSATLIWTIWAMDQLNLAVISASGLGLPPLFSSFSSMYHNTDHWLLLADFGDNSASWGGGWLGSPSWLHPPPTQGILVFCLFFSLIKWHLPYFLAVISSSWCSPSFWC